MTSVPEIALFLLAGPMRGEVNRVVAVDLHSTKQGPTKLRTVFPYFREYNIHLGIRVCDLQITDMRFRGIWEELPKKSSRNRIAFAERRRCCQAAMLCRWSRPSRSSKF